MYVYIRFILGLFGVGPELFNGSNFICKSIDNDDTFIPSLEVVMESILCHSIVAGVRI